MVILKHKKSYNPALYFSDQNTFAFFLLFASRIIMKLTE